MLLARADLFIFRQVTCADGGNVFSDTLWYTGKERMEKGDNDVKRKVQNRREILAAVISLVCFLVVTMFWLLGRPREAAYTITQYASVTGRQGMCYLITDREGHLAVVDGGWKEDGEWLLELLVEKGGKVDAWILTHPHPDHVGAFNGIYASGLVDISTIYAVPVDHDLYQAKAQPWDEFGVYEEFLKLTEGADNLVYLEEGDSLDLFGLAMEVFHSFDPARRAEDKDPCNNGGLIFKLSAREESMLFLADVGSVESGYLLEKYGERLQADYVQMGHHGNGGMEEGVYRQIAPKLAFFDMPDAMMQDAGLDAVNKRTLLESLGAQIRTYGTAPNAIGLK